MLLSRYLHEKVFSQRSGGWNQDVARILGRFLCCWTLTISRQRHTRFYAVLIHHRGIPQLSLRASKDHKHQIAEKVKAGSHEKHYTPFIHICLMER